MKIEELLELAKRQEELGLDRLMVTMPTPKFRGPYPRRVRTPFGLCEWYPSAKDDRILVWVTLDQVRKFVKKALAEMEASRED